MTNRSSKYRILRRLGVGGYGDVFLARDELASRHVAIKRLKNAESWQQADLVHEMGSLNQPHHPNVVGFFHHSYAYDGPSLFVVMEHCAGGSLRAQIGSTQAATIMQWGMTLADVLAQVHQRGIGHHDIKPENILFTGDGTIKIGDFGAANGLRLKDRSVSRRHCVIVNVQGDVWVYDLASKFGVSLDGVAVRGKAYLDGVRTITVGNTELRVSSRTGLLV
jgi:serine/threonine protein kinase